jgi:hypothetical protein
MFMPSVLANRLASIQTRTFGDPVVYLTSEVIRLGLFRATPNQLQITETLQDVMLLRTLDNGFQSFRAQARRDSRFMHLFPDPVQTATGSIPLPVVTPASRTLPRTLRGEPPSASTHPPASLVPLALFALPFTRAPLDQTLSGPITGAVTQSAPVLRDDAQEEYSRGNAKVTPAAQHQVIEVIDLCVDSPQPAFPYNESLGRGNAVVVTGRSVSGSSYASATSGEESQLLEIQRIHNQTVYRYVRPPSRDLARSILIQLLHRSSDWWSLMNTIDDLQALGLHRDVSFRISPHSTGWVKDSDILGSYGVRANLTQADMMKLLVPSCAEGLLVMGNSRDINGQAHYYFETLPTFRALRAWHEPTATARDDIEGTEDGYAGSMDTDSEVERDVRFEHSLKRSAGPGQLPGHKGKRPARTIHQRSSASSERRFARGSSELEDFE